ncbi:MAG: spermidine/putrescine ABC transporter substrate-binding protein [Oscillospiraceae bacterium]|jgi:spermidine/putrescine transport system substrate-binding protein|nr:spermidine/putrescine ABC transporter substrate-binding protein [Oscillospiraceae bacterium]
MFKKSIALFAMLSLLFALCACGAPANEEEKESALELVGTYTKDLAGTTLNVYNWGEYISSGADGTMDVVAEFQKLTGIKVNYSTFDNNEMLYTKIAGGGTNYDVIIPSDYMISRMIEEGMLNKINLDNIPNMRYVLPEYTKLYYDPTGEYSVPYTIGMVGMIYNTKLVSEPPTSWSAMWDPQYKGQILQFDNPRDAFGMAQYLLGQDVNTANPDDWRAAADKLIEQAPLVQSYVSDKVYNLMEDEEATLAAYYAGDFVLMNETNPNLAFVFPDEGTNFFYDSFCIPKAAQNVPAAELFINFMLEPAVAIENALAVMYASPYSSVRENPDYVYKDNPYLYPETMPAGIQNFTHLSQDTIKLMDNLWVEVKQAH